MNGKHVAIAIAVTATIAGSISGCSHNSPSKVMPKNRATVGVSQKLPQGAQNPISKVTEEDLYHFNCLTMGNRKCGPKWQILDAGWKGQVRFENPKQDPTNCKVLVGDTTYIDCPNGKIYTS